MYRQKHQQVHAIFKHIMLFHMLHLQSNLISRNKHHMHKKTPQSMHNTHKVTFLTGFSLANSN